MTKKIAIIGGGIAGLSAGFYVQKAADEKQLDAAPVIFEATDRLGGKFNTLRHDGFVIERGPDSFLKRKPAALGLARDLGLEPQLVANKTGKSYILHKGQLHLIPPGSVMGVPGDFTSFLASDLLSDEGKARVFEELLLPPMEAFEDISVGEFFEKRLGRELVSRIIEPLLSGVYGGNLNRLSLEATLPQFKAIATQHGHLLQAVHGKASGKRTSQFATLSGGLSTFTEKIVASLHGKLMRNTAIDSIEQVGKTIRLHAAGYTIDADALVFAAPLREAQDLLPELQTLRLAPRDADSGMTTLSLAYDQTAVQINQQGTGFVSSDRGAGHIAAATWTHLKWPHTAPQGKALLRVFYGHYPDWNPQTISDEALAQKAIHDLNAIDGLSVSSKPDFFVVTHMPDSMPQYGVGQKAWLKQLEAERSRKYPNIYFAGMAYDGVGIPDVIRQGKQAAQSALSFCFNQELID